MNKTELAADLFYIAEYAKEIEKLLVLTGEPMTGSINAYATRIKELAEKSGKKLKELAEQSGKKLKFEDVAVVGDRIRSYDFAGRKDCYVEGEIQRITNENGYKAFVILVDTDVFPRRSTQFVSNENTNLLTRIGQTVFVPMEISFLDYDDRIVKLIKPHHLIVPRKL